MDGRPAFIARQVGAAIGYAQNGKRFATQITSEWKDDLIEGKDYAVIPKVQMEEVFKGTDSVPFVSNRGTLVLFESGLHMTLVKTGQPLGVKLRRFLVDEVLPQLVRTGRYEGAEVVDLGARRLELEAEVLRARSEYEAARAVTARANARYRTAGTAYQHALGAKYEARGRYLEVQARVKSPMPSLVVHTPVIITDKIPEEMKKPSGYSTVSEMARFYGFEDNKGGGANTYYVVKALKALGIHAESGVESGCARRCIIDRRDTAGKLLRRVETFCYDTTAKMLALDQLRRTGDLPNHQGELFREH